MSIQKMGFWSVTSLVAGSQIGTGIFLLPASLATFGSAGLMSWFITGSGAVFLAFIFAKLCSHMTKTGGPHTYVEAAFGKTLSFFCAWTYWVISWLSSPLVVIAVVTYLTPLIGNVTPLEQFFLECMILIAITWINLFGLKTAGSVEFVFTLLKLIPLIVVPCAGLFFMHASHFTPFNPSDFTTLGAINAAALLTMWGFIGVETATTPGDSVENPTKTIPKAIITGTLIVASVYILSSIVIMGVVPPESLLQSKAPFADAASIIFGGNWHLWISVIASLVCLGTLNAWVLTSGQIALGAANDGHFPQFFSRKNKNGAPVWSILISVLGMIPVLALTMDMSLISQINFMIDVSVTAFLFVYLLCTCAYWKLFILQENKTVSLGTLFVGIGAFCFCVWALWGAGLKMVSLALLISLSGLPIYWIKKYRMPILSSR